MFIPDPVKSSTFRFSIQDGAGISEIYVFYLIVNLFDVILDIFYLPIDIFQKKSTENV